MKILVIGAAIIDIIMEIECLPKKGDDVLCNNTATVIGGCAYNVASMLRNFKVDHDLFVPVGIGHYGDIIRKDIEQKGYKVLAENAEVDNGYCLSLVENDGERTFITVQGAEANFNEKWFSSLNTDDYNAIYIAGYQTLGNSGKVIANWLMKNLHTKIFYAPGPLLATIEKNTLNSIFSSNPILHLNKKEILEFFNEKDFEVVDSRTLEKHILNMYELTKNIIIVTLGEEGTIYYDGKEFLTVPTSKVKIVDTIGAGDSHIATVIACLSKGKTIKEAVIVANEVAGGMVSIKGPTMSKLIFEEKGFGGFNE